MTDIREHVSADKKDYEKEEKKSSLVWGIEAREEMLIEIEKYIQELKESFQQRK